MTLQEIISNESLRNVTFPCTREEVFLGHAGVAAMPQVAVDGMTEFAQRGAAGNQENAFTEDMRDRCRAGCATLIGARSDEIALIGPTSVGLSLVARGLDWVPGDEVIFHADDYPANVYPWRGLEPLGVKPVAVRPEHPGAITWELIEQAITPKTRLVSLATCHFLTGYRIDYATIGRKLHERGILFCLDAIQTLGAFPMDVTHVDFLSADSHKWMLGPCGAGLFYVKREHMERVKPALLGSWNVVSPEFVAQETLRFEPGGRRYEPGTLNFPGICGMTPALELLLGFGIETVADRLLHLRSVLLSGLGELGYKPYLDEAHVPEGARTGIVTMHHPDVHMPDAFRRLQENGIAASLRENREGRKFLRFSPHCYNTESDFERVFAALGKG
jgi:selenocysteine lyase/cysteine desulfurase